VQAAHVAFLDEGAFERWSKPTQRGTPSDWWALISIKFATVMWLMRVALSTRPGGFTLAQVVEVGSSGQVTPSRPTPHAMPPTICRSSRARIWCTASRDHAATRLIRPASGPCALTSSCAIRSSNPCLPVFGRPPKVQAPVNQHYVRLRGAQRNLDTIGLAAA
jgi:hypothetical protein